MDEETVQLNSAISAFLDPSRTPTEEQKAYLRERLGLSDANPKGLIWPSDGTPMAWTDGSQAEIN